VVFWLAMLYSLVGGYQGLGGMNCLHFMKEEIQSFKTFITVYKATEHCNPEDHN
jgi:hypothetical protein